MGQNESQFSEEEEDKGLSYGRQYRAKSTFVTSEVTAASPKRRNKRRSLPTHIADIVHLAAKSPSRHRKELGARRRSSASVLAPPSGGSLTYLSSMSECDENDANLTFQCSCSFNRELTLENSHTHSHRKFGYSNPAMSYEDFDIVGESSEHRFPWQRDISVQCCIEGHGVFRRNLSSNCIENSSDLNSFLSRNRTSSLTRLESPSQTRPQTASSTSREETEEPQLGIIENAMPSTANSRERCMEALGMISPQTHALRSPRVSPITINDRSESLFDSDSDLQQDTLVDKRGSPIKKWETESMKASDDHEPSPSNVRRGRRAAVIDTKNIGDVSPTNISPVSSPCSSEDEADSDVSDRLGPRGSFDVSVIPSDFLPYDHSNLLMKRNTIADFSDHRKGKSSFNLIKKMRARSKESLNSLEDLLRKMKPTEFKDNHLSIYKSLHWTDLIASSDKTPTNIVLPEEERKRREAVWELFKAECVYLIDHLMVLKHCFMEPLKKLQVEGYLMFAEPQDLLGNLDELCYVSYTFCKDFIASLLKDISTTSFGNTNVLIQSFERFTTHSRDGGVYHTYCLNYTNALPYLHQLRKNEEFAEFEKWCSQDPRCNRLKLTDLLVAPLQHCTKFPLLLGNVKKYTSDEEEKSALSDLIEKVNSSLQKMEDKMKWAKNFERLEEIQKQLIWPPVSDLAPRAFIPEFLKSSLLQQPCENFLATQDRQLLFEGYVTLYENGKGFDIYIFVFEDVLLLTKPKKIHRKKHSLDSSAMMVQTILANEKRTYTVYRQPIAVDRLCLYDVSPAEASVNGLKNAIVLVQFNRYHQIIDVLTIQCGQETTKNSLMERLHEAIGNQRTASALTSRTNSVSDVPP
ncbi:pleckstrin homology domain-containing family G member 7-like [Saccostrea cucullata]|uniref:pleckstrin homology domain-containing family G member 7-like n=1 Tax=Saccostrea cuccullata TaxID=36930 RepID=UPI002ED3897F